jgi:cyclophilin family peptidyl-prolyl cis-trans isomerase
MKIHPAVLLAVVASSAIPRLWAASPVIDPPIPAADQPARVAPNIPVGKTLLFPITASDSDGDLLSYKVSSSNPNILVRVKTGNPTLRLSISHADGGAEDPPYAGTMDFMLFRDWLPASAGFVAGMAQAGFYDGVLFHRIADLGGGAGTTGFIFQGGDPLGTGGGGPGITGNDPQTAWKFQNEFHVGTIFSGRGQLAMANAGTQTGYSLGSGGTLIVPDYLDTNGSQFFITDGQPRHLDFKHNIFGQMLRGWELLPKLKTTKTTSSRPDKDLKIVTATIVPNTTDAVLVFSAKATGTAVITISATDPSGAATSRTFTVNAVADTTNSAPFLRRVEPIATPKDIPAVFALEPVDLEYDYLDIQHSMLPISASLGPKGSLLAQSGRIVQMQPTAGYSGIINMGFSIRQFDISGGGFTQIADYTNTYIAAGDRPVSGENVQIEAQPGVALPGIVVARLYDLDLVGAPGNFTAKINWGDGTPLSSAAIARDLSSPESNRYVAIGGHTYAKSGVYPVVVDFVGDKGTRTSVTSHAYVSGAAIRAVGENFRINTARVVGRRIATFTDTNPSAPSNYAARVDWGDGLASNGRITRDRRSGKFIVEGTHGYMDSEPYAVAVWIRKKTEPATPEVLVWTTIDPRFTARIQHLPPFPHAKLTIAWNSTPAKSSTGQPGPDYQVTYKGTFVIINTGTAKLKASKLRFWLSTDRVLNKAGVHADTPVTVNNEPELDIIPFPAGAGGNGDFTLLMPKGESTGGKYLLAEADYNDPIANSDGSDKVIVTGPLPPTVLIRADTNLQTNENGATATFKVLLDTPPGKKFISIASITAGNPVTIKTSSPHGLTGGSEVKISNVTGGTPSINGVHTITVVAADTITIPLNVTAAGTGGRIGVDANVIVPLSSTLVAEGTVSPAELEFTAANWNLPQTVTITGVDDTNVDGNKVYKIKVEAAESGDTDFNGLVGGEVPVTNLDNEPPPPTP